MARQEHIRAILSARRASQDATYLIARRALAWSTCGEQLTQRHRTTCRSAICTEQLAGATCAEQLAHRPCLVVLKLLAFQQKNVLGLHILPLSVIPNLFPFTIFVRSSIFVNFSVS